MCEAEEGKGKAAREALINQDASPARLPDVQQQAT